MVKLIEKGLLLGLGTLTLTRERVAKFVDKLIEEGQVRPEEAPGVVSQLVARGEEEREALHRLVLEELEKARASVIPVTRGDFAELEWKVDELAEKLDILLAEEPDGQQ